MSSEALILVPLGTEFVALTQAELSAGRQRAAELGLGGGTNDTVERLVDSKAMGELLGVVAGKVEELGRTGEIPSVRIGKYVRFKPSAVIAALQGDQDDHHHKRGDRRANSRRRT